MVGGITPYHDVPSGRVFTPGACLLPTGIGQLEGMSLRRVNQLPRRQHRVRSGGYTLIEGLIASTILSASVIGIAGAMTASYAHDEHVNVRAAASMMAQQLLSEVTALPLNASAGEPSISDYNGYADTASTSTSSSVTARQNAPTGGTTAASTKANNGNGSAARATVLTSVLNAVGGIVNSVVNPAASNASSTSPVIGGTTASTSNAAAPTNNSTVTVSTTQPPTKVRRAVTVKRTATPNGATSTTGDFAVVTVTATADDGSVITLKRMVSAAESTANR